MSRQKAHVVSGRHPCCILLVLYAALAAQSCVFYEPDGEICGDGRVCPPGFQCAANQNICIAGDCGNGVLDPGEVCDDGNVLSGDGCSADCLSTELCGNGYTDTAVGEQCDDGNNVSGDGCSADCLSTELCGNGYVDVAAGEQCDEGGASPTCDVDCTAALCGDDSVNPLAGEQCDDGVESPTCNADCTAALCGDAVVNLAASEQCDDGNGLTSDGCPDGPAGTCMLAYCGDGFVRQRIEQCDTGNGGIDTCGEQAICGAPGSAEQCTCVAP